MKKTVLILLAVLLTATANAQRVNKYSVSELNQDQLNAALVKSLKTIKTGKIITGTGIAISLVGAISIIYGINESNNSTEILGGLPGPATIAGTMIVIGGVATTAAGGIKWTGGLNRKKEIEIELVKYQSSGSAVKSGIGLKIMF